MHYLFEEIFAGIESILREPYGCFEQTSSSTYPNILVLQLLNESFEDKVEQKKKALDLIEKGYNRLITYECKDGGFDWFGHSPGHEALTAYLQEMIGNKLDGQLSL